SAPAAGSWRARGLRECAWSRASGAQGDCRNGRPRLETPACAKRLKPVTDTEDGFYVLRAVRAQVFSQPANMYIQRAGQNPTTVPPDAHQEDLSRNALSG